jgi:hypothetical protein
MFDVHVVTCFMETFLSLMVVLKMCYVGGLSGICGSFQIICKNCVLVRSKSSMCILVIHPSFSNIS